MEILFVHADIRKFIEKLDFRTRAEIVQLIEILAIREYQLEMPFSKKIEKDIYELRIKSTQSVRIFYTFRNNRIFLLHAVLKKSQKLRPQDLETVRVRLSRLA